MKRSVWILMFIFFSVTKAWSQQEDILSKKVRLQVQDEPLPFALAKLGQASGVDMSYSSDILPDNKKITLLQQDIQLKEALDSMLIGSEISYRVLHGMVVIYREKGKPQKAGNVLKGIIVNAETGEPVQGAILYDKYLGIRCKTNEKGAYHLNIPNPDYTLYLEFQALGYKDKSLRLQLDEDKWMNLMAFPEVETEVTSRPVAGNTSFDSLITAPKAVEFAEGVGTVAQKKQLSLLKPFSRIRFVEIVWPKLPKLSIKPDTVEGLLVMPAQVTFFSPLGSNRLQGRQTINHFSFNMLAGYSAGVQGIEFGGLVNVNRFNMEGLQIGGLGNLVGGQVWGLQFAGITNTSRLRTKGAQISGFNNFSGLDLRGLQLTGFNNSVRGEMTGAQIAGFNNVVTKDAVGLQFAGFANTSVKTFKGLQVSGITNVHWGEFHGWQFSGLANFAGNLRGLQTSVFINKAKQVNGIQLGLFNVADTVAKGASIGLLSLVLKGYRRIEFLGDEMGLFNIQIKTGSASFYNVFSAGAWSDLQKMGWQFGYGFGSRFLNGKHVALNADLTTHFMNEDRFWVGQLNLLHRLSLHISYRPRKRTAFFAGPSLRYHITRLRDEQGLPMLSSRNIGWELSQRLEGETYYTLSLGFQLGMRF